MEADLGRKVVEKSDERPRSLRTAFERCEAVRREPNRNVALIFEVPAVERPSSDGHELLAQGLIPSRVHNVFDNARCVFVIAHAIEKESSHLLVAEHGFETRYEWEINEDLTRAAFAVQTGGIAVRARLEITMGANKATA